MVPDKLIVTVQIVEESLLFIDLVGGQVYSACADLKNLSQTVTGNLSSCVLNAPSTFTVFSNNSIYIATIPGFENYYEAGFSAPGEFYKMDARISICHLEMPSGKEISIPAKTAFYQFEYVTIECFSGWAINSSYDKVQCSGSSTWSYPLPGCVQVSSPSDIHSLSPTFGQVSGGTLVTAVGLIPNTGVEVYVNSSDGVMSPVEHNIKPQKLSFKMPNQTKEGEVQLIIKLSENVTAKYDFVYGKDPVMDHTVQSATLVSGGFDMVFYISNINSSGIMLFLLGILTNSMSILAFNCSVGLLNILSCDFTYTGTDFEADYKYITVSPVLLYSDGVLMKNFQNISITVYADPKIKVDSLSSLAKNVFEVSGRNLDIGVLNQFYQLRVWVNDSYAVSSDACEATDTLLRCTLASSVQQEVVAAQMVIGNLKVDLFAPFTSSPNSVASDPVMSTEMVIVVAVISVVFVAGIALTFICYRKRRTTSRDLKAQPINWYSHIDGDLKARLQPLIIKQDMIKVNRKTAIGKGNFGAVYTGQLLQENSIKTVAIKVIKNMETTIPVIEKFLEEAVILQDFRHANVLETLGVSIPDTDTPQVVLPYMANGDLKSLIQIEHIKLTFGDLMHFAKQVACGMEYLSSHRFVHRDLAARNCLVSEEYIVKIADFGLSKDLYSKDYYQSDEKNGVPLPIKWLALESLNSGMFTTMSDVWSYGVLVWELCTRGAPPYSDVDSWDVKSFLQRGRRLNCPTYCPPAVWHVISNCWLEDPEQRPTFTELHELFTSLLENVEFQPHGDYTYIRDYTRCIPDNYYIPSEVGDVEIESSKDFTEAELAQDVTIT
ncbi:MET [Bugula neritina]|uniref:receptor protein-tyrosine kinase n=1 Tax=Bugula neritina TaxID=10212 RepID=A0A7J7J8C9_BUGNE|nr:MET [Bugula neritina]